MNVRRKLPWLVVLVTLARTRGRLRRRRRRRGDARRRRARPTRRLKRPSASAWSATTGGLDDRGFNEFSIAGFDRAQSELGVEGRVYVSESGDDYLPNLTAAVDDGHDLVVAIGFLIQPSVVEVATEATDVNFAGVDQFYGEEPDCGGEDQSPCVMPNVPGLQFPSEEAGYLAGIVAAMMSSPGPCPR